MLRKSSPELKYFCVKYILKQLILNLMSLGLRGEAGKASMSVTAVRLLMPSSLRTVTEALEAV